MTTTIIVKPAPGPDGQPLRVMIPAANPRMRPVQLPAEGKRVPRDAYWLRRLATGEVVEVTAEAPAEPAADPKPRRAKEA